MFIFYFLIVIISLQIMANEDSEISFLQISENFRHFVRLPSDFIPDEVKLVIFAHFIYHFKEIDRNNTSSSNANSLLFFRDFEMYFSSNCVHEMGILKDYLASEETTYLAEMKGTLLWKIYNAEPFDLSLDSSKLENASLLLVGGTGKFIPLIVSLYFPNLLRNDRNLSGKKRKIATEEAMPTLYKKVVCRLKLPLESLILINETDCKSYLSSLFVDNTERTFYFMNEDMSHVHYLNVKQASCPFEIGNRHVLERRESTTVHAMKAYSGGIVLGAGNVLEKLPGKDSRCEPKKLTFPSSYINCFDVNQRGNLIGGCFGKTIFLYDTDAPASSSLQETEDYESSMNEYFSSLCLTDTDEIPSLYIGSTLGVVRKWDVRMKSVSSPFPKFSRSDSIVNIVVSGHYMTQISKSRDIQSSIAFVVDERFPKESIHQYFSSCPISSSFLQGDFFGISHGNTVTVWNLRDVSSPCNKHVLEGYVISGCIPTTQLDTLLCSVF